MSVNRELQQQMDAFRADFQALRQEIGKLIVGQDAAVEGVLTALFAGGHVLLEGPPGVGKTLLGETLAQVTGLGLQRISFTPDLMPADVIGTHVVMENAQGRRTFEFHEGPLFANLVLADHINRGTPKTQSALLEAMESEAVSVSNERFELPQPFVVLATQNPQEMEGVFPLPEPQLDRFLLKLTLAAPNAQELEAILDRTTEQEPPILRAVIDAGRIVQHRETVLLASIAPDVRRTAIGWAVASNPQSRQAPAGVRRYVRYGISPRGAQAVILAAKVRALVAGRLDVSIGDLRTVAKSAWRHRLILNYEGHADNIQPEQLIEELLAVASGPQ